MSMFSEILKVIEERMVNASNSSLFTFLKALQKQEKPSPGSSFSFRVVSEDTKKEEIHTFQRPQDADNVLEYVCILTFYFC